MSCVRIGGLEAFADDIRIPLKYGVDQCVGDTICAGGIMYGQRGIPATLEFCKDMREVAEPGVRFLNYANPMAMMTWACLDHGGVETIGLCHGVQNGWRQIAARPRHHAAHRPRHLLLRHQPPDLVHRAEARQGRDVTRDELIDGLRARTRSTRGRRRCASTC